MLLYISLRWSKIVLVKGVYSFLLKKHASLPFYSTVISSWQGTPEIPMDPHIGHLLNRLKPLMLDFDTISEICELIYKRSVFTYWNIQQLWIRYHLLILCKHMNHAKIFSAKDSECKLAFTTVMNLQLH